MRELVFDQKDPAENVREYSYHIFKMNILKMHLRPGDTMSEAEAASKLDISRTPVHDTFARLAEENLLLVCPQKPTMVSLINADSVRQAIFTHQTLSGAIVEKLYSTKLHDDILFTLEANLNQQYFCVGRKKLDHLFLLDQQFHQTFYEIFDMQHLWETVDIMSTDLWRVCHLFDDPEYFWTIQSEEHFNILHAIRNRDYETACRLVRCHMETIVQALPSLIAQFPDYFIAEVKQQN